jgi:hypothetical protein
MWVSENPAALGSWVNKRLSAACGEATPNGDALIPLPLKQSDLASLIGSASRVRLNQALNFYKRRNYFSVNRNPPNRVIHIFMLLAAVVAIAQASQNGAYAIPSGFFL